MFQYCVLAITVLIPSIHSAPLMQDGEYIVPNSTAQCAQDLIDWCDGMKFGTQGAGLSLVSITISEPNGFFRYFCASDSDGANCTRNGEPWFSCSSDHVFYYKGKPLTKDSADGSGDDICRTADRAFNDLLVQNLSVDNSTIKHAFSKSMESFFQEMAYMQEQLAALEEKIFSIFGGGFPFFRSDPTATPPKLDSNPDGNNQLEREQ